MSASIKSSENSMTDERDPSDAAPSPAPVKKKSKGAKRAAAEARVSATGRDEGSRAEKRAENKKARAAAAQRSLEEAESERRLARLIAIALPLSTVGAALAVGASSGIATGLLVLAGGVVLGAVAAAWASVRTLTGDAPLPHSLEAAEMRLGAADSRVARRTMLLRALKDLESERAIGKLSEDDYESVAPRYREELKALLKEIDAELSPHRPRAEHLAAAHMRKVGLAGDPYRSPTPAGAPPRAADTSTDDDDEKVDERVASTTGGPTRAEEDDEGDATDEGGETAPSDSSQGRVSCPKCDESNEPDAKFCKGCGGPLRKAAERTTDAS